MIKIDHTKRFAIVLCLIVITALYFWTQSRYPALTEKAIESGSSLAQDVLTPRPKYVVDPEWPLHQKIYTSWLNWIHSNKQGMIFGVIFGALFLVLFQYFDWKKKSNVFTNSFIGLLIGAPLGVCVNCAAPIMVGMLGARRMSLALSAMMASPTLNIVVLTMSFTLFPSHIIWMKIVATLVMILILLPLSIKFFAEHEESSAQNFPEIHRPFKLKNYLHFDNVISDLMSGFIYMIIYAVPLMFLAGLLGAIISHLPLLEPLIEGTYSWWKVIPAAVIGTFLPVPIGFDVVLAHSLYESGISTSIAVSLLISLGSYSIYSYFIVWKSTSLKVASIIFSIVLLTSTTIGWGYKIWHDQYINRPLIYSESDQREIQSADKSNFSEQNGVKILGDKLLAQDGIDIYIKSHNERVVSVPRMNIKIDSGLKSELPSLYFQAEPQLGTATSLASADLDLDGHEDIVSVNDRSIFVFRNKGSATFERKYLPPFDHKVVNLATIDLNNDRYPDFVISTYYSGLFIGLNPSGKIENIVWKEVPGLRNSIISALSFYDFDGNGFVDILLGRSYLSHYLHKRRGRVADIDNHNGVLFQDREGEFTEFSYKEFIGETLANQALPLGNLRWMLISANDFGIPSTLGILDGKSKTFELLNKPKQSYPGSGMSVDIGDPNRDGNPDIFISASYHPPENFNEIWTEQNLKEICSLWNETQIQECHRLINFLNQFNFSNKRGAIPERCQQLEMPYERRECFEISLVWNAIGEGSRARCEDNAVHPMLKNICRQAFEYNKSPYRMRIFSDFSMGKNYLYETNGENVAKNLAPKWGVSQTCWTWDAKFADLDNDGFEDLFISNGFAGVEQNIRCPNQWFHNQQGKNFSMQNSIFQEIPVMTSSYIYGDWDQDGDLDMIIKGPMYPVRYFENNLNKESSLTFEIYPDKGQVMPYGLKVEIFSNTGKKQTRWLMTGRGYVSHDQNLIHFGIKEFGSVEKLILTKADGNVIEFKYEFKPNHHYTLGGKI